MTQATFSSETRIIWGVGVATLAAILLAFHYVRAERPSKEGSPSKSTGSASPLPRNEFVHLEDAQIAPRGVERAADAGTNARKISTREVARALMQAQKAMVAKDWGTALIEIENAAVATKTPFETYQVDEFLSFVLVQLHKYGEAVPVFERMLASGFVPPEKVADTMKTIATLHFQQKNYAKAAQWSKNWLAGNQDDEKMSTTLAQSYYMMSDYANAAATMSRLVESLEQTGKVPQKTQLLLIIRAGQHLNDDTVVAEATDKMRRYYPE